MRATVKRVGTAVLLAVFLVSVGMMVRQQLLYRQIEADSVEAASRSLKEYTPEAITALVNKIIDTQIAEGLHNDSPLSFRDVQTIKQSFINRLRTIYHSRVAYPEDPRKPDTSVSGA